MSKDDQERRLQEVEQTQDSLRCNIAESVRLIARTDRLLARSGFQSNDNQAEDGALREA